MDSLRIAGDDIDLNIKDYIKNKYKMDIGLVSAEKIKMVLGNASGEYYKKLPDICEDEQHDYQKEATSQHNEDGQDNDSDSQEAYKNTKEIAAQQMEIRGRDVVSGLPLKLTITSDEIREGIIETINSIVNAIKRVLERTPPELSSDIYANGIYLSGGGALLKGLDLYIEKETGIKVFVAESPLMGVALGAGKISENL